MIFKNKEIITIKATLVILFVIANLYYVANYNSPIAYREEDPKLNCPDYTFFVEETEKCVPFRNDEQEHLYNQAIAGSTNVLE